MANPFAMTEEENALFNLGAMRGSPYAVYQHGSKDPIQKILEQREAERQLAEAQSMQSVPQGQAQLQPPPEVETPPMSPTDMPTKVRQGFQFPMEETPEQKALRQAQEAFYRQSMEGQKSGVDALQKQYDEYGTKKEINLAPFMAALDILGDTNNLAKSGYQQPDSEDDIKYKKAVIGQMLQKAKEGISETELKRLAQMSSDKTSKMYMDYLKEEQRGKDRDARFGFAKDREAEKHVVEITRKDIVKPTENFNKLYKEIDAALASGDIKRVKGTLNQVARGIQDQKGVLTEGDIGRVMFPQISTDIAEFDAYLGGKSKLEPKDIQYIRDGVNKSRSSLSEMSKGMLKAIEDDYGATSTYGHLFEEGKSLNRVMRNREKDLDRVFGAGQKSVGPSGVKEPGMTLSLKDQQALDWANKNPADPRAQAIKQRLGM